MKGRACLIVLVISMGATCLMGSGCATILSGSKQTVMVTSEPNGVRVTADDGTSVVTPGQLKLARNSKHVLVASCEGCEDQKRELRKNSNEVLLGNILVGGLIGIGVDFATGAAYELQPGEISFDFTEEGQVRASQRAEFIRAHSGLDNRIRVAILNGLPERKMTREQLLVAIGDPDSSEQDGKYDVLTYNNRKPRRYYLKKDVLVKMKK